MNGTPKNEAMNSLIIGNAVNAIQSVKLFNNKWIRGDILLLLLKKIQLLPDDMNISLFNQYIGKRFQSLDSINSSDSYFMTILKVVRSQKSSSRKL